MQWALNRCTSSRNCPDLRLLLLVFPLPFVLTSCIGFALSMGHLNDPPAPRSRSDIAWAVSGNTDLRLSALKLEDFPALKKFYRLRDVHFNSGSATDAKIEALADVGFTNLQLIVIHNCPLVTDCGIESLSRIGSLRSLVLRNTSVTDRGLEILIAKMQLGHVNVARCTNVTAHGLLNLVQSETLASLGFSPENLTEAEVSEIFEAARNVKECWIYYPNSRARTPAVAAVAQKKGIKLVFEGVTFWTHEGWELSERRPLSPEKSQ